MSPWSQLMGEGRWEACGSPQPRPRGDFDAGSSEVRDVGCLRPALPVSLCVRSGRGGFGEPWGDLGVLKLHHGGQCVPRPFVGGGGGGGVCSLLRLFKGPVTPPFYPEVPPALPVHPPQLRSCLLLILFLTSLKNVKRERKKNSQRLLLARNLCFLSARKQEVSVWGRLGTRLREQ